MSWWLKAHRAGPVAGVAMVLGLVAWLAASGRILDGSVASPVTAGSAVPLALWLPLAFVATLCWACSVDDGLDGRAIAARPNRRLLTLYAAGAALVAAASLGPAALAAPGLTAGVARNLVGLVGLALILRPRVGAAAASALTAAYLAIAALSGPSPAVEPPGGRGPSPPDRTGSPPRRRPCSSSPGCCAREVDGAEPCSSGAEPEEPDGGRT